MLHSNDLSRKVKVVSNLQNTSKMVFKTVMSRLKSGMSEEDIASEFRTEFRKRNISDFWYSIPIIVLISVERFLTGANANYDIKSPANDIKLKDGSLIYIDLHPMDQETKFWGDWNSMIIYRPREGVDDEQVIFLEEMRQIHRDGIAQITSKTTGKELIDFYTKTYESKGITPIWDKIKDIGHTLHEGPKDSVSRRFITADDIQTLGGNIIAVEPSGFRRKNNHEVVVARFEECIYIPENGIAIILGNNELLPLIVN